jgi:hypothetical protein
MRETSGNDMASWPSGKARVCKTLIRGSNPLDASTGSKMMAPQGVTCFVRSEMTGISIAREMSFDPRHSRNNKFDDAAGRLFYYTDTVGFTHCYIMKFDDQVSDSTETRKLLINENFIC